MGTSIQRLLKWKVLYFQEALIENQSNQHWNTAINLKKQRSKYKSFFDLLVSYHDFQFMFLSPIVG